MKQRILYLFILNLVFPVLLRANPELSPIANQATDFPLFTKLLPREIERIKAAFQFGHFQKKDVVALRPSLLALAQTGDPVAQFYYAATYDLYEFGQGDADSRKVAIDWYLRAANQNYARAEFFLYHVYAYELMQIPSDPKQALHWLHRAYLHSSRTLKAEVALEFARVTSPNKSNRLLPTKPDANRSFQYLQEAHQLDPQNQTAIDWLVDEQIERKAYKEAILLAKQSKNSFIWRQVGELCLTGGPGFAPNLEQALQFLKRAAEAELHESKNFPSGLESLMLLYSLVCQKRIKKESLGALNVEEHWHYFNQFQRNCVISKGG